MKTIEIGAFQAKTHLSQLLEQVRHGQTYYITKRGRRLAELRPAAAADERLRFGCDKGDIVLTSDFDAPLPGMDEYMTHWTSKE